MHRRNMLKLEYTQQRLETSIKFNDDDDDEN